MSFFLIIPIFAVETAIRGCRVNVMRCLVMVRVSTDAQSIDDQHREMEEFCRGEGYDELVFVEDKGASAIKLDDTYRMMIGQVRDEIERDPSITCFAVWELSRAFRNELVFQEVKQFLVGRRIQFLVKNPYLKLLNPDGSVNSGMEIAVTLMATLAKQEMELKRERFMRAKRAMRSQGKFVGGRRVKFGYRVDGDGYVVIDERDSVLVRLIFELYGTGEWSIGTLLSELTERGYQVSYTMLNRMLADRTYIDGVYPPMISRELWDRCESVRRRNLLSIPKGHRHCFASGILKCPVCGRSMVALDTQYRCWGHNKRASPPRCPSPLTIRVDNLDGLLWFVAVQEETKYRMRMSRDDGERIGKEVSVLREKLSAAERRMAGMEERRDRILELYEEGLISKDERSKKLLQWKENSKMTKDTILALNERIEGFLALLRANGEETPGLDKLKSVYEGVLREDELREMARIVRRQVRRVSIERSGFRGCKSSLLITVETVYSGVRRFYYVARRLGGHYFFTESGDALVTVRKIVRAPAGEVDSRVFKKLEDWDIK